MSEESMGAPETATVSGAPAFFSRRVSLWFPLSAGNTLDELLHPIHAVPLHLVRHMAIDIQGKSGRGVPQVSQVQRLAEIYIHHQISL